jgi:hypothetical protein
MTWTKTGDEFADECWTLSDAAYRLHHEGLTWSNRKLLDGQLPKDDMHRWVHHPEAAEELVSVGWWEDRGQHYQIIHQIGYQRTRKQVASQSIANQKNAARRWQKPSQSDLQCDSQSGSTYEMDGTGRDGKGLEKEPKNLSANGEKNDSDTDYFATLLTREPTTDSDGFPLDDGGHR